MPKMHIDNNPADILTKVVATAKFEISLDFVGLND